MRALVEDVNVTFAILEVVVGFGEPPYCEYLVDCAAKIPDSDDTLTSSK